MPPALIGRQRGPQRPEVKRADGLSAALGADERSVGTGSMVIAGRRAAASREALRRASSATALRIQQVASEGCVIPHGEQVKALARPGEYQCWIAHEEATVHRRAAALKVKDRNWGCGPCRIKVDLQNARGFLGEAVD